LISFTVSLIVMFKETIKGKFSYNEIRGWNS